MARVAESAVRGVVTWPVTARRVLVWVTSAVRGVTLRAGMVLCFPARVCLTMWIRVLGGPGMRLTLR